MRVRLGVILLAISMTASSLAAGPQVLAQPTDAELATARELFNEVRKLEGQLRWAEALQHLNAIAKVRMTPQVRFHIALCEEHLGRLVSALNGFQQARVDANAQGAARVAEEADQHIAAIRPRVPAIRLNLPPDAVSTAVTIDDQPIAAALLSVPIPVDPGAHIVRVRAEGREDFRREVVLAEAESATLDVVLAQAAPSVAPTPPAAPAPIAPAPSRTTAAATPPAPKAHPLPPHEPKRSSTAGWIVVGAGGVTLVGAGVAALVRSSAISDIDESCPSHTDCDPSLRDTRDRAQTSGIIGGVLGVVGVAAVATGGVLIYLSSKPDAELAPSAVVAPHAGPHGAGISGVVRW